MGNGCSELYVVAKITSPPLYYTTSVYFKEGLTTASLHNNIMSKKRSNSRSGYTDQLTEILLQAVPNSNRSYVILTDLNCPN